MGKEQWQQASADWLPEGWKVEVRRRSTGRIDKCYTDPSNEHKFKSKPEVLRYLKYSKTTCQPSALAEIKANIAESPAESNKESGVIDKGNESSGHLLSAVKANNIAESPAELNKEFGVADKGNESSGRSVAVESEEKMVAGSQSEQHTINKQRLITETGALKNNDHAPSNNLKEGVKAANPNTKKRKNVKADDQPRRASRRIAGIEADDVSLEPPTVLTRPRRSAGKRPDHAEVDSSADKGKKPADSEEPAKRPSPEHESNNQNTEVVLTRVQHPARKRLNHVEVDSSTDKGKKPADPEESAKRPSPEHESNNQNTEMVLTRVQHSAGKKPKHAEVPSSTENKGKKPADSKELAKRLSPGHESNNQNTEMVLDVPFSELLNDPCIEFAFKTLTGEMPLPIEDDKPTLAEVAADQGTELFPPTDIWADPCFEFAVKTLTGDLPVDTDPVLEAVSNLPPSNVVQSAPQAKNKQMGSTAR